MPQTKRQKQEKALVRLEKEYKKARTDRDGYFVGNIYHAPVPSGRELRIKMEIETLKRKLGIR